MSEEMKRLASCFAPQFQGGMENIKFFLHPDRCPTMGQFVSEVSAMEDAIAAGRIKTIDAVDAACPQIAFDAPFNECI